MQHLTSQDFVRMHKWLERQKGYARLDWPNLSNVPFDEKGVTILDRRIYQLANNLSILQSGKARTKDAPTISLFENLILRQTAIHNELKRLKTEISRALVVANNAAMGGVKNG